MDDFPDIAGSMKNNILMEYLNKIRCKVLANKKKVIAKIQKRKDHQMVLSAEFKRDEEIHKFVTSNLGLSGMAQAHQQNIQNN